MSDEELLMINKISKIDFSRPPVNQPILGKYAIIIRVRQKSLLH